MNALAFVYKRVLGREAGEFSGLVWAQRPRKVPGVLGVAEARRLLAEFDGSALLMAQLLYGAGLRPRGPARSVEAAQEVRADTQEYRE